MQRSLLVGLLLGDGHLELQSGGREYRLKVEHGVKQKDYVDWLYEQFKDFVRTPPRIKTRIVKGITCKSYGFTTYSYGSFRFYAQQFYVGRKKVIPKLISKMLDPRALAIWFMDDGSFKSVSHKTYIIHTHGYEKKDLERVKDVLQKKFGIIVGLHKQYDRWRIYIMSDSATAFRNLVSAHVIPSMRYKLGNIKPKE